MSTEKLMDFFFFLWGIEQERLKCSSSVVSFKWNSVNICSLQVIHNPKYFIYLKHDESEISLLDIDIRKKITWMNLKIILQEIIFMLV